jgi:integral membrane protein
MQKLKSIVGIMSIVAILEGLSYLFILFVSMPLKYFADMPMPNKIGGMFHGILFVLYIVLLFPTAKKLNWGFKTIAIGALASVIPFGTFWFDKKYLENN